MQQSDFIHKIWAPGAVITTGGYDRASGLKVAEETGQLVGYCRAYAANVSGDILFGSSLPSPESPAGVRVRVELWTGTVDC